MWPLYVVLDLSKPAVSDESAVEGYVHALLRSAMASPRLSDIARIGVVGFSDRAQVIVALGEPHDIRLPTMWAGGGANYGAVFRELAHVITQDITRMEAPGRKVYRPVVFFLTYGRPADRGWIRAFRESLTYDRRAGVGFELYPIFMPFGLRGAPHSVARCSRV